MIIVGSAKVVDATYNVGYIASSEESRMVCREALSDYLDSHVSSSTSRTAVNTNGKNKTSFRKLSVGRD